MISSRAQHAAPLPPLFGTCAVGSVQLVDKAAVFEFAHEPIVDDVFGFDFADLWIARF
jgi:hypothetical protein